MPLSRDSRRYLDASSCLSNIGDGDEDSLSAVTESADWDSTLLLYEGGLCLLHSILAPIILCSRACFA